MTLLPTISTINDLFIRVSAAANPRAVLWQDEAGKWQPLSSDQIYQRVRAIGNSLLSWGVQHGDRVAIIGENRWEWMATDFAVLAIGAANVPVYPTLTGEQIAALLTDADCRVAVVSTLKQFDKINAVRHLTPLQKIVLMDDASLPEGAIAFSSLVEGADQLGSERDDVFDERVRSVKPDDLASLIYTSGTTGEPKGVALTHGNFAANQNIAAVDFSFGTEDALISFLPLSHVTARALDYVMFAHGVQVAYCSKFDKLPEALREIRPTVFVGVPRVFEKIRLEVELRVQPSPIKRRLLAWALKLGANHREVVYDGRRPDALAWKLAWKLVYGKVREAFGGRVRVFVSGGAPLGIDTANWFASMGIPLWEGYGLTETSPLIAINSPIHHRLGAAGKILSNVEVHVADDGEILVRGPSVFHGYWKKPHMTAEAIDAEGWFHTGDIGVVEDGFLTITDRKKELLKTSGGKLVAPAPIEAKFQNFPMVAQVVLVGDRHKFVSVLIAPNFRVLEDWAKKQGIATADRAALVADKKVVDLYAEYVRQVNLSLANFETLKRFRLVADEWTQETGEMTPSMKLKRRFLTEKYADVIAALYSDEATARGE